MNGARLNLAAAAAFVKRDAMLYVSYRWSFLTQIASVFVSVALFYYVSRLVTVGAFSPDRYFAFVLVGIAILQIVSATLTTVPTVVRGELVAGTFERLVVSPFGPAGSIVSMSLFPVMLALLVSITTLGLGALVFDLPLAWSTAPLALPIVLLGVVAFLPLALLICAAVLLVKQAGTASSFLLAGMTFASGTFFPIALLPAWVSWASEVQPLTPVLELLRYALVDRPLDGSGWVAAAKLAGFAIVMAPISVVALDKSIGVCRRRGTLIEY